MTVHKTSIRYETEGVSKSTGEVIQLTNAMDRLEKKGPALGAGARSGAQGVNALDQALGGLGLRLNQTGAQIDPLNRRTMSMTRAQGAAAASAGALAIAMGVSGAAAGAYGLTLVALADRYAALQGRIRIYSASAAEAARTEAALFAAARETRQAVEPMVALYSRLQPAMADMGRSQQETLAFTTLVSKALATQGATTQETQAATVQLAQALASGVVRGDEFRSLMEAAPGLMRNVALGMGVGVGALRGLAEEGELTADVVIAAIERMSGKIEGDFAKAPKTVGQAWQVLQDAIMRVVGMEAQATGAQSAIADALLAVADAADEVTAAVKLAVQAAMVLGTGALAAGAVRLVGHLRAVGQAAADAAAKARALEQMRMQGAVAGNAIAASADGAAALNAARIAEANTRALQEQDRAMKDLIKNSTTYIMQTQQVSREAAREQVVAFAEQNREGLLAARAVQAFSQEIAGASRQNTYLAMAQRAATSAMNLFRGAAGFVVSLMGGPWGVAFAAAAAAVMAFAWWTDKARHAQDGFAGALADTEQMVKAYERAVLQANKATGEAREAALKNAAAQREEALAYYHKAQAAVAAARVQAAEFSARAAMPDVSSGRLDAGAALTFGVQGARATNLENQVANAEGKLRAAEQALEQMGALITRMGKGRTVVSFGSALDEPRQTGGPPAASDAKTAAGGNGAAEKARREAEQLAERVADARRRIAAEGLQLERQEIEASLRDQEDAQRRHLARFERMSRDGNQAAAQASVEAYERAGVEIGAIRSRLHQIALAQLQAETEAEKVELQDRLKGAADLAGLLEQLEAQQLAKRSALNREYNTVTVQEASDMAKAMQRAQEEALARFREENRRMYEAGEGIARALRDGVLNGGNWESVGQAVGRTILEALYDALIGDPLTKMIRGAIDNLMQPSDGGRSGGGILSGLMSVLGFFGGGGAGPGGVSGSASTNARNVSGSVSFPARPQIAGSRAGGGDVRAGLFYRVNETEQEFFAPRRDGAIWTPRQLGALAGRSSGSAGTTVNIHNHTGAEAQVRRRRGPGGLEEIDVMLRERVEGMARSGDLARSMGIPQPVPVQG